MQNGQHRAVSDGVHELVAVPGGGQGAGLRLAVAHHAGGDQVRIVCHGAEGVGQGVSQLAALMNGAGGLGGHMAGDAAGEGEPLEELLHAVLIPGDVGVDFGVAAVQPVLGHHGIAAVAGAGEVNHVQVVPLDDPVQMGVDEVLARAGAPVAHDGLLQVGGGEGPLQQGIIQQIQLAGRQIVGGAPVGVYLFQLGRRQGRLFGKAGAAPGFHAGLDSFNFLFGGHGRSSFDEL